MSGLWIHFGSRTSGFAGLEGIDERHEGKRGVGDDSSFGGQTTRREKSCTWSKVRRAVEEAAWGIRAELYFETFLFEMPNRLPRGDVE